MFTMLELGIFNMKPKFECHSLSFKRITDLTILYYVNNDFAYISNVEVTDPVLDLN